MDEEGLSVVFVCEGTAERLATREAEAKEKIKEGALCWLFSASLNALSSAKRTNRKGIVRTAI